MKYLGEGQSKARVQTGPRSIRGGGGGVKTVPAMVQGSQHRPAASMDSRGLLVTSFSGGAGTASTEAAEDKPGLWKRVKNQFVAPKQVNFLLQPRRARALLDGSIKISCVCAAMWFPRRPRPPTPTSSLRRRQETSLSWLLLHGPVRP
jgi:hypothetical protein